MSNAESLAARPDYLKAYSLNCEPFANALDGRFFYGGSALMQRLDLLTHLTQFGESIILVSGPSGSGKTTLLGRFVGQTGKHWRLCLINAEEFAQFGQRLRDALGIGENGDEQHMLEQWAAHSDASQLLVIAVDDSQLLPADAVQKLCTLLDQRLADRVRLVLFGSPEAQLALKQTFDRKNLPCTAQLLELPKLTEEDTSAYLMYRLAVAGYSGESPFTPTEVRAICKAADGRPAAINRLAHEALLEHQIRSGSKRLRPRKKPPPLMGVALALASILLLAAAIHFGWQREQPTQTVDSTVDGGAPIARKEVPLSLPAPQPAIPQRGTPAMASAPDLAAPALEPALPAEPEIASPPPAQAPKTPVLELPVPTEREADRQLETMAEQVPAAAEQAVVAAESEMAPPAAGSGPNETPAIVVQSPVATAATAAEAKQQPLQTAGQPAEAEGEAPHREAWLLQQPPGNYSLQLLGARSQQSIIDYVRQNKLSPEQTAYYRGNYKGGEWYVLVYGVYPSRQAALDARADLPARVRKEKPWPRTLASVHTAIREGQ